MDRRFFLAVIIVMLSSFAYSHQDRIIQVGSDGGLIGLPDEYLPASINVREGQISIGGTTLNMPPCVFKYFQDHESYDLSVTSSWYHQRSSLPPYIQFKVSPKNKDFEYSLLFALKGLKVIDFEVITHPNKGVTSFHTIDIGERCKKSIERAYE
ncbi:hypothetical protein [Gynuella sunshinyii]|uniref:hypothetical protein n=1 Tax=Gynuella sunshinyii TaxID=1445505 RepID=UPI0005CC3ECB|nr:hypothetical protein [Gynuella sunshinyii]